MAFDLEPIPSIPAAVREAALRERLIPFIGAGASRLAGCPGWADFADGALRQLIDKGKFTHFQLNQIKHLNPRVKLSIAEAIAADAKTFIDYGRILHPRPLDKEADGRRLYKSLFALGNVFVTTNYDRWLDSRVVDATPGTAPVPSPASPLPPAMRSVYDAKDFLPSLSAPNTVIHLHGSVADRRSMILTTHDYLERYANDRRTEENWALTFLEYLFGESAGYTVLFIGYGLEELEILEYVIRKAKPRQELEAIAEPRHFILQGFFSHEKTLKDHMEGYYRRECGIQLMPFLRDKRDHGQLLYVLDEYARSIPASAPLPLADEQKLEDLARAMELLR